MGERNKKLSYLFTILFIVSIIYTTLRLFSLQDDLILSSQVLDSSQIIYINPVLIHLYIAVGLVMLTGVIMMALNFRTESAIDISSNSLFSNNTGENSDKTDTSDDGSSNASADTSFVKEALKSVQDKNEQYTAVLNTLCKKLELGQGAVYMPTEKKGVRFVKFYSGFAFSIAESETVEFEFGEGLVGQAAKEGQMIIIDNIPDDYINIVSGLGNASPKHLMILPLKQANSLKAVIELASFHEFTKESINLIKESFQLLLKQKDSIKDSEKKKTSAKATTKKTTSKDSSKKKEEEK